MASDLPGAVMAAEQQAAEVAEKADDGPLLLPAPRPATDVTLRGIQVGWLLRLVEAHDLGERTIQEVVDTFVRPSTAAQRCTLFDIVPPQYTGRPRFFISHTWSRKTNDLLKILKRHFEIKDGSEPSTAALIWLDIVAINQHPYEERGQLLNDDVANLERCVRTCRYTLFCLDPNCVSLTRIWCIFEAWKTISIKTPAGLVIMTFDVPIERLQQAFIEMSVQSAQATQPEDRDRILKEIEGGVGFQKLNQQLARSLVESAAKRRNIPWKDPEPQPQPRAAGRGGADAWQLRRSGCSPSCTVQ